MQLYPLFMKMAIIEYLDETRGAPQLMPKNDSIKRQQVCYLCMMCKNTVNNGLVLMHRFEQYLM